MLDWPQAIFLSILVIALSITRDCEAEPTGSIGISSAIYEDTSSDLVYHGRLGWKDLPVYLTGSYESPKVKMLGQPLADSDIASIGLGFTTELTKDLSLFFEGGYSIPNVSVHSEIEHEVVYTRLVKDHHIANRPIPLVDLHDYRTSYSVDNGMFARIGLSYTWQDHFMVTAAYRALHLDQEYTLRVPEGQEQALIDKYGAYGEGYWRQDTELNMSSFQLGISLKF